MADSEASLVLLRSVLTALIRKGVITRTEVREICDIAIAGLQDENRTVAARIVAQLADALETQDRE